MNAANLGPDLKSIVSALVSGSIAFLSSLLTALQGEHTGFDTLTAGQWVTAALAFPVGLGNQRRGHLPGAQPARRTAARPPP